MLAVQTLADKLKNKNVTWIEPNGGFTIWLTMNNTNFNYDELNKIFRTYKIRLALGKDFFPHEKKEKYFRLAIASLDEKEIVEGIGAIIGSDIKIRILYGPDGMGTVPLSAEIANTRIYQRCKLKKNHLLLW